MRTYRDFPNVQIPEVLQDWDDQSWTYNGMPHSKRRNTDGSGYVVWVNRGILTAEYWKNVEDPTSYQELIYQGNEELTMIALVDSHYLMNKPKLR